MGMSIESLRIQIQKEIDQNPTLSSVSNISVTTGTKGSLFSKKGFIELNGSVRTEADKKKIEETAHHFAGNYEVVSRLKVSR